jgi:uncharacterized protein YciI
MALFAVVNDRGAAWDWSIPMRSQRDWDAHAAFMDALVEDHFILAGGPLGDEDTAPSILHIVEAFDAEAVDARLATDPWRKSGLLSTTSVRPWTVLLGSL